MQPFAPGFLRVAQASRDVALLQPLRGTAPRRRRACRRVFGDLAALAVAASDHPVREPGGLRAVLYRDSYSSRSYSNQSTEERTWGRSVCRGIGPKCIGKFKDR